MALPKTLNRIEDKLDRIMAHLGLDAEPEPGVAPQGIKWTGTPQSMPEPEPEPAESVAARLEYDTYTANEVIERIASLTAAERTALADYERTHKARKTVLEALEA